jgi:hypothetical protein
LEVFGKAERDARHWSGLWSGFEDMGQ